MAVGGINLVNANQRAEAADSNQARTSSSRFSFRNICNSCKVPETIVGIGSGVAVLGAGLAVAGALTASVPLLLPVGVGLVVVGLGVAVVGGILAAIRHYRSASNSDTPRQGADLELAPNQDPVSNSVQDLDEDPDPAAPQDQGSTASPDQGLPQAQISDENSDEDWDENLNDTSSQASDLPEDPTLDLDMTSGPGSASGSGKASGPNLQEFQSVSNMTLPTPPDHKESYYKDLRLLHSVLNIGGGGVHREVLAAHVDYVSRGVKSSLINEFKKLEKLETSDPSYQETLVVFNTYQQLVKDIRNVNKSIDNPNVSDRQLMTMVMYFCRDAINQENNQENNK